MKKLLFIVFITCSPMLLSAQSSKIVDSLLNHQCREIIVLKEDCIGCLTLNRPCEKYGEDGNFENFYIFWRNDKKMYVKKTNICGQSKAYQIKKWNKNPFDLVNAKRVALDTTQLKYPLHFIQKDSIWVESSLNHNQFYTLDFPAHQIKTIKINGKAFKEIDKDSQLYADLDIELKKNIPRYIFNNQTAAKELLDILDAKILALRKKIETK